MNNRNTQRSSKAREQRKEEKRINEAVGILVRKAYSFRHTYLLQLAPEQRIEHLELEKAVDPDKVTLVSLMLIRVNNEWRSICNSKKWLHIKPNLNGFMENYIAYVAKKDLEQQKFIEQKHKPA